MSFKNRIRLPIKLTRPQFPKDKSTFRYADGTTQTLSVVVKKTYEGETDYMAEKWHQRLVIAMEHDNVTIEGDKYLGDVVTDGDYSIDWPKFMDYPTAKAEFTVQVTPFDNTNDNCQTCEEAQQLSVENDVFPDPLEEDTDYSIDVADNDNICCYPAVFSISSYNTDYITSAEIDQLGNVTLHTKASFMSGNGVKLLTYRVTCPNGRYDEADITGDMDGSIPGCLAPSDPVASGITATSAHINFTASPSVPHHYLWRLFKTSAPGVQVQTGTSTTVLTLTGLSAGTAYKWFVRAQCEEGNDDETASNFIELDFMTNTASASCGEYKLNFNDPFGGPGAGTNAEYQDCNGVNQPIFVPNNITRVFCARQTTPGVPVYIFSNAATLSHGTDSNCSAPAAINLFVGADTIPGDPCSRSLSVWIPASSVTIGTGVHVYTDAALTVPFTGWSYIGLPGEDVYHINSATGIVGASTGTPC